VLGETLNHAQSMVFSGIIYLVARLQPFQVLCLTHKCVTGFSGAHKHGNDDDDFDYSTRLTISTHSPEIDCWNNVLATVP